MEEAVKEAHIFVTATGCADIIHGEDGFFWDIRHFDCEVDVDWLNDDCQSKDNVKPQVV